MIDAVMSDVGWEGQRASEVAPRLAIEAFNTTANDDHTRTSCTGAATTQPMARSECGSESPPSAPRGASICYLGFHHHLSLFRFCLCSLLSLSDDSLHTAPTPAVRRPACLSPFRSSLPPCSLLVARPLTSHLVLLVHGAPGAAHRAPLHRSTAPPPHTTR